MSQPSRTIRNPSPKINRLFWMPKQTMNRMSYHLIIPKKAKKIKPKMKLNSPKKNTPDIKSQSAQDKKIPEPNKPPESKIPTLPDKPSNADKPTKEPQAENLEKAKSKESTTPKPRTLKKPKQPEKPTPTDKPPKAPKPKQAASVGGTGDTKGKAEQATDKTKTPPPPAASETIAKTVPENVTPPPEPPRDANRINEKETIVYIDHSDLHPFKDHPFQVRNDDAMKNLVASIKERGVDQAAIVRPREGGGYELIAGHRRQAASEMAGIKNVPCVVRNMTDEEAILAMTESNFNQRSEILPSERAQALKMQLDAIKRQGERFNGVAKGDIGKRSNEIVAEKNKMSVKTMQRHIALNNLTPDLMKLVDDKKITSFMVAFEMSYIKPKNQDYIAMTIEAQDKAPALAQAQRMRDLDSKGILNGDVIDGIMLEDNKKEEIKVILTGQELSKYFGADKTPREMKDTILKLLDEHKAKNPPELAKPEEKAKPPQR